MFLKNIVALIASLQYSTLAQVISEDISQYTIEFSKSNFVAI
jgi:hypothetical protein